MQKVKGEPAIKKLKTNCSSVRLIHPRESSNLSENSKPVRDIFTPSSELYQEESADIKIGIKRNSHIIEKLILRERLNTLILILHAGNMGYSLAFRTTPRNSEQDDTTAKLLELTLRPYEQKDLIDYINREELPPHIMYLLDKHYSFLFYNGCVITEVRDFRQSFPSLKYHVHHVILRPTLTSLHADINNMIAQHPELNYEEKQQIESRILLASNPSLCLDPRNDVCTKVSEINHNHRLCNTHELARSASKHSQEAINRKRKLDQFTYRPGLELLDFRMDLESGLRAKPKTGSFGLKYSKPTKKTVDDIKPIPAPNFDPIPIDPPSTEVFNEYKIYQRPEETSDCAPELLNFYILEPKERGKWVYIKISILQRPSDSEVLGELYLDRNHKEGERNGVKCRFSLGTRSNASKFINQFKDILTDKGKIDVRITSGLKERQSIAASQTNDKQQQAAASSSNLSERQLNQLQTQLESQLHQVLQNQTQLVNGTVAPRINLTQQNQKDMILHNCQQGSTTDKMGIDALATKIRNEVQQFEAAANAKQLQQQQQQNKIQNRLNTTMINILKSSPVSNINSEASAAVVNAINNSTLLPQQIQTVNQKIVAHKATLSNVGNARVLNHNNLVTVNRADSSQIRNAATGNYASFTTVPVKQSTDNNKTCLPTLLVGSSTSDNNTNSLLLEQLNSAVGSGQNSTHFIHGLKSGVQYMVQTPQQKVVTPISSPPAQNSTTNTINLTQFQRFSVLSVSSTGNIQGHPTSLLVSLPSTSSSTANTITQTGAGGAQTNSLDVGGSTVILTNATSSNLAQLVTSGVKGLSQQNIRASAPNTVLTTQGSQSYQLVTTPVQRPQQRSTQRTPITVKMATQNTNATQGSLAANASLASQLQKQAQYQQYQRLYMKQQQNNAGNVQRRPNPSESQ